MTKEKQENKQEKKQQPKSKTKFLGISIIVASVILGGSLIYAAQTLSGLVLTKQDVDKETEQGTATEVQDIKAALEVTKSDHVRGESNAAVTLVEFSDFQCPFCSRFHPTVTQILDEYSDEVRWVYKHFPLDALHPQARPSAEASECAAEQGKFWEFGDALFENQSGLSSDYYTELARDLGLNLDQFNKCASTRKYKDKIEADYQLGIRLGVRGTPATFVNGELLVGAVPYSSMKGAIEKALANQ